MGSGTQLLERSWTFHYSLSCVFGLGTDLLLLLVLTSQMSVQSLPSLLGVPGRVLDSALTGDPIVIPGDFNAHVDIDSYTWRGVIGRNKLTDMNPSVVLVLDF